MRTCAAYNRSRGDQYASFSTHRKTRALRKRGAARLCHRALVCARLLPHLLSCLRRRRRRGIHSPRARPARRRRRGHCRASEAVRTGGCSFPDRADCLFPYGRTARCRFRYPDGRRARICPARTAERGMLPPLHCRRRRDGHSLPERKGATRGRLPDREKHARAAKACAGRRKKDARKRIRPRRGRERAPLSHRPSGAHGQKKRI